MVRSAFNSTVSPAAYIRPPSGLPSTVVLIQEERLASTLTDSLEGLLSLVVLSFTGTIGAVAASGGGDAAIFPAGSELRARVLLSGVEVRPPSHQYDPPANTVPTTAKSATNVRSDRPAGTATESLGNADESKAPDADDSVDRAAASLATDSKMTSDR